jgi:hypothetical protein
MATIKFSKERFMKIAKILPIEKKEELTLAQAAQLNIVRKNLKVNIL